MKQNALKIKLRAVFSLALCLCLSQGATVRIFGQTQNETRRLRRAAAKTDAAQAFAQINRFGRGADFVGVLMRELPPPAAMNALGWLDARDENFFEAVTETHRQKTNEVTKRRFGDASPATNAAPLERPVKPGRKRVGAELSDAAFFNDAAYRNSGFFVDASGEPSIATVETENGVKTVGEVKNTVETAEAVLTKRSNADTEHILNDSKNGQLYTQTSFEEVFNKITRGRVRNEKKFQWNYLLAQCPDANGVVEGEAEVVVENKATIANTTTIAIPAQVLSMKVKLKGYVDDDAQLTHFDMTGEVSETTTGYDRAKRLGMIDENGFADGTRRFTFSVTNNKFTAGSSKSAVGEIREDSTAHLSNAENNRLMDFADLALPMNLNGADDAFATARTNWQSGFCVDVSLTAAKETLKAGEIVKVAGETVHKLDNTKVNARLEATGFAAVLPGEHRAEPSAEFVLRASTDADFGSRISVKSVSKRGIGTKTLEFGREEATKKPRPPVKKAAKYCDGAWTGKIKVVKAMRDDKRTNQASGRLLREVGVREETFSIDYNALGVADASQGFKNAFFAEAQATYRDYKYSEKNYAAGKMTCGGRMMTSPETRKFESVTDGRANERLTIFVTSTGEKGILTLGSPQMTANQITTTVFETDCPDYDRVNSGSDRSLPAVEIAMPFFEIEFELDAESPTRLEGVKKIQNEDGSETVVTWNLTRDCK
ncbi:MAG TPA: hypothetical protein VIL74_18420 [Pyrinomonadaceae bacterium]|jgi:hypothetical protein